MNHRIEKVKPFFAFFGLIFAFGVVLAFYGKNLREETAALQSIPIVGAAALQDSKVDREVFVEGQISPDTPKAHQALVAYIQQRGTEKRIYLTPTPTPREGGRSRDRTPEPAYRIEIKWETVKRELPPLLLTTDTGTVQIEAPGSGNGYTLRGVPVRIEEGLQRYLGLRARDRVVALGAIKAGSEENYLDARIVAPGTRQQFIGADQKTAEQAIWVALGMIVVSALVMTGQFIWVLLAAGSKR
jgi:hypothetical protein